MAIIKKTIAGQDVGYDTETHSFCNLPKDYVDDVDDDDELPEGNKFADMTDEQLTQYAATLKADISRCRSRNGIIKKLIKAEQGAE